MEHIHKPVHNRRVASPLQPSSESSQVYSDRLTDQLKISLQQENSRLVQRIHDLQLEQMDFKRVIERQEKEIAEYKSYYSNNLAQDCVELKKQNSELKNDLAQARQRLLEHENGEAQEEIKQLKRALRSANYNLELLRGEKENNGNKKRSNVVRKLDDLDVPEPPPPSSDATTLGKRKAHPDTPTSNSFVESKVLLETKLPSSEASDASTIPTTSTSTSTTTLPTPPTSATALASSSSSSSSSSSTSTTTALVPSEETKVKEEPDDEEAARGKKRGRETELTDAVDWPSQSTALSDFESDSDISLTPPPAVVAKTDSCRNALEQVSVIGAQVSNLEALLQQQQLRADTERRRNLDLRKEHENLRKKNAVISAELEDKISELSQLKQSLQKMQATGSQKAHIRDTLSVLSQTEEVMQAQLLERITRYEQRLIEMAKLLHSLDQKRQRRIASLQSQLHNKSQESQAVEVQVRAQLQAKEDTISRLQTELQQYGTTNTELVATITSKADAFAAQVRELEARIEQMSAEEARFRATFQEQEAQTQAIRREKDLVISSLQTQEVSLSKLLESAHLTNEELTKQLQMTNGELATRMEASRAANEALTKEVQSARIANEELTKHVQSARVTNSELLSQLESLRLTNAELTVKIEPVTKMNEDLLKQVEATRAMHTETRQQFESTRGMNEDLSKQLEVLRNSNLELAAEITRLGQVTLSTTTNIGSLEEKNKQLMVSAATLEERNLQLTAGLEKAQREKADLETRFEGANTKLISTQAQAEELRQRVQRIEQELSAKTKESANEYQKIVEHSNRTQQELVQISELLSRTQAQLATTQNKLDVTLKQNESLLAQRAELQAVLAQDQQELTSLREKVSQLASTTSTMVEAKTHELQRQAQLFQDSQTPHHHPPPYSDMLPVPEALQVGHDSSAEEEAERTPPTPVLADADNVKTRSQATSPNKTQRSTRRRLAMPEGAEAEAGLQQVRVLFTGWKDRPGHPDYPYSIARKNQLAQMVSELGGVVPPDQEKLDKKFTHMCVPPECRTAKSLGAALMGKFVVPPQWVLDSKERGYFQPEAPYGAASQQQLKGKVFYVSDSFKARWGSREEKMVHVALKLIVTCGSGIDWSVTKNPEVACDFTLVGDEQEVVPKLGEPMPRVLGKLLTWDAFLDSVAMSVPVSDAVTGPSISSLLPTKDGLTVSPEVVRKRALESAPTPPKHASPVKRRHVPVSPTAPSNRRRHVPSPSSPSRRSSRSRDE